MNDYFHEFIINIPVVVGAVVVVGNELVVAIVVVVGAKVVGGVALVVVDVVVTARMPGKLLTKEG